MRVPGLNTVLLLAILAVLLTVVWMQWSGHPVSMPGEKDGAGIEYKDFLSLLLTALGVMVAVATLVLAGLAVYGFAALKDEATKVARTTAEAVSARAVREVLSIQTTADEAEEIAAATGAEVGGKGGVGGDL